MIDTLNTTQLVNRIGAIDPNYTMLAAELIAQIIEEREEGSGIQEEFDYVAIGDEFNYYATAQEIVNDFGYVYNFDPIQCGEEIAIQRLEEMNFCNFYEVEGGGYLILHA